MTIRRVLKMLVVVAGFSAGTQLMACQTSSPTPESAVGSGGREPVRNNTGGAGGRSTGTGGSVTPPDAAQSEASSPDATAPPAGARPLTANDVSVLVPTFADATSQKLWPASLSGKGGPLLSFPLFERLLKAASTHKIFGFATDAAPMQEFDLMRVVAIRFDPCFPKAPCQAQIRLVLQAFQDRGSVFDGGVHLLYNLTQAEFREVVTELRALTALAPENRADLPLSASPALKAQGMEGPYGKALRTLVTRYAGAGNLARMTFMNRTPAGNPDWNFGGFDVVAGEARQMAIPGLPPNSVNQQVNAGLLSDVDWGYAINPLPVRLAAAVPVTSHRLAAQASPAEIEAGYGTLLAVSNPLREDPEGADCATCHLSNHLRAQVERNYKLTPATTGYPDEREATRATAAAEMERDNLRAFGYFGLGSKGDPSTAISQRVANETHRVLQLLQQMY